MLRSILFTGIGYFSGSILFARVCSALLKKNIVCDSPDQNPGTFNAFRYGGFLCGVLTLCGDLLKGFLPAAFPQQMRQAQKRCIDGFAAARLCDFIEQEII